MNDNIIIIGLILAVIFVIANSIVSSVEQHIMLKRIDNKLTRLANYFIGKDNKTDDSQNKKSDNEDTIG